MNYLMPDIGKGLYFILGTFLGAKLLGKIKSVAS